MRKNLYRTFSALMIVAVLTSSTMSSFAAPAVSPAAEFVAQSFGAWLIGKGLDSCSDFIKDHIGYSAGKVCKSSTDGYHHCESSAFGKGPGDGGVDDEGRYSTVVCKYCGESFKYYSSFNSGHGGGFSSDLQQSYEAQVEELPVPGIGSDGALYYIPPHLYFQIETKSFDPERRVCEHCSDLPSDNLYMSAAEGTFSCSFSFYVFTSASSSGVNSPYFFNRFNFVCPITGTYKLYSRPQGVYKFRTSSGQVIEADFKDLKTIQLPFSSSTYKLAGESVNAYFYTQTYSQGIVRYEASFSEPIYRIEPETGLIDPVADITYNINSRPTSITGDYGIIGDNGEITKIDSNTIVNENNKTVYNPVTNTTSNVTDWQYDYSTRTYKLTLDNGNTSTVTYGDENVTIQEGDTTYNVYYLVENSTDTPDPGPDTPCDHSWTETSTTPATCTVPGSRLLTCSLCNQTKTEAIPAPGHTWQIKQTVATQYDGTGQLIQQGYTIFECSVCHEQYKSEDGAAPPGGTDPPGEGSGFLDSLAQTITGTLSSVLETVFSIFDEVPSLFDGFLAFLSAMFPYLPPEIITLLTFGIAAVVFIGIVKAFRR